MSDLRSLFDDHFKTPTAPRDNLNGPPPGTPGELRLGELLDAQHRAFLQGWRLSVPPSSYDWAYRPITEHLGDLNAERLTGAQIDPLLAALRAEGQDYLQMFRIVCFLQQALASAHGAGWLTTRPDIDWLRIWQKVYPSSLLEVSELQQLARACETREDRLYMLVLLATLAPLSSAQLLETAHLDRTNGLVHLPPGRPGAAPKTHVVPLLPSLAAAIDPGAEGFVLPADRRCEERAARRFKMLRERAGLHNDVTSHSLMVSGIYHLRDKGVGPSAREVWCRPRFRPPAAAPRPEDVAAAARHLDALCREVFDL